MVKEQENKTMLIDIFHDTACPWCWIGKKHLFDALEQWQGKPVDIRWHPFLLDSTIPPQGYEFRTFMQSRKGIRIEELERMFDYTRQVGEVAGVKLNFDKISLAVNTTLSHQLIALASENIKNTLVEAIYKAYFENGLNIGDIDVLLAIGAAAGMDAAITRHQLSRSALHDAVVAQSTFAQLNGITSVPFFVINNQIRVDGFHSVEVFLQALTRAEFLEVSTNALKL